MSNFENAKIFEENLLKYWGLSGAKACKSCRSRQELSNAYFLAKFGFDTAENELARHHMLLSLVPSCSDDPRCTSFFARFDELAKNQYLGVYQRAMEASQDIIERKVLSRGGRRGWKGAREPARMTPTFANIRQKLPVFGSKSDQVRTSIRIIIIIIIIIVIIIMIIIIVIIIADRPGHGVWGAHPRRRQRPEREVSPLCKCISPHTYYDLVSKTCPKNSDKLFLVLFT